MSSVQQIVMRALDFLLGWILYLPGTLALLVIAILSAMLVVSARRLCTDQELLARCAADKRRLKELFREARQRGDRPAQARMRATQRQIALKQLKAEGRPLLVVLLPFVLLATWSFQRLEFRPLQTGEPIGITARFTLSALGDVVHLVPEEKLQALNGWIQEVAPARENSESSRASGAAVRWSVRADAPPRQLLLQIRHRERSWSKSIRVGERFYERPVADYDGPLQRVEIVMHENKLFGFVPGIFSLPAWLVGYVLLVVPVIYLGKRLFRVY